MIADDTYQLLEEYYGREVELSTVVQNMDRAGIIRLLDDIIEDSKGFPDDEYFKNLAARARVAKREL